MQKICAYLAYLNRAIKCHQLAQSKFRAFSTEHRKAHTALGVAGSQHTYNMPSHLKSHFHWLAAADTLPRGIAPDAIPLSEQMKGWKLCTWSKTRAL